MTIFFPILILITSVICIPAYKVSRRNGDESKWLIISSLPAFALWVGLTGMGYGAQSLSNIVEILWVMLATVVLSYVKVFLIDPKVHRPKQATLTMIALLTIGAFLLRTYMPILPE